MLGFDKNWTVYISSQGDIPEEKIKELVEKFLAEVKNDIDVLKLKAQGLNTDGELTTDYLVQGEKIMVIDGGTSQLTVNK